jgi:hydrogenase nickel incorporation protein HypB
MNPAVLDTHELHSIADVNRGDLRSAGVFAVSLSGGPGCGKTTLIDQTVHRLSPGVRIGVIACYTSYVDADRTGRYGDQIVKVNTAATGVADPADVHEAIRCLDLSRLDLLFIENAGGLIGPVAADLGEDVAVVMFSVAGGDDRADDHPELVRGTGLVLLSKTDLLPKVPFDRERFRASVRRHNAAAELFEVSALHDNGMCRWSDWLQSRVRKRRQKEPSQ